jgi:hypothetical protein
MTGGRRRTQRAFRALIALAVTASLTPRASAQMPGYNGNNQSERVWKRMDACKRQAWKAHPDYTREGSAKRDEETRHCLEARGLPPVAPRPPAATPAPPPERSGSSR